MKRGAAHETDCSVAFTDFVAHGSVDPDQEKQSEEIVFGN